MNKSQKRDDISQLNKSLCRQANLELSRLNDKCSTYITFVCMDIYAPEYLIYKGLSMFDQLVLQCV